MDEFNLKFDWEDPVSAKGEELRATWARLEISIGEIPIIEAFRKRTKTTSDYIYMPLYPLAEWIATNWWFLFYERFTPGRFIHEDYYRRHDLNFAQEGYFLPHIVFFPSERDVEIEYRPSQNYWKRARFMHQGSEVVDKEILRNTLGEFVEIIIERLHEFGVHGTLLEEEWQSILNADEEERQFCRFAAALGLDPYSLSPDYEKQIIEVHRQIPESIVWDFFSVINPKTILSDASSALISIEKIMDNPADFTPLKAVREKVQKNLGGMQAITPWKQGYETARLVREVMGLNGQVVSDLEMLGRKLKIGGDGFFQIVNEVEEFPKSLAAIGGVNRKGTPSMVLPANLDEKRSRFAIFRSMHDFFRNSTPEFNLVTKTRSDMQKRNRAFAAEFLVPSDSLKKEIQGHYIGPDEIDDLATKFNISSFVIEHQIENHHLAEILEY